MKTQIKSIIYDTFITNGLLKFLPDREYVLVDYFIFKKRLLNFKNPRSFSEKIQWLKVYGGLEKYARYVDKYEVREFIKKTIGKKYLVPLLGIWSTFEEIPFDKLPKQFILKSTNGSGASFVCHDKSLLDQNELKKIVDGWMTTNFYLEHREIQYKPIRPRILCEEYLDSKSDHIGDYKFFCSNGRPKIIEIYSDVFTSPKVDLFTVGWKKLDVSLHFPSSGKKIKKPSQLDEMIQIAKKLSMNFPFVRVDLYVFKQKVYFGELTFTPGNGMYNTNPPRADLDLGKLIDLSEFR